MPQVFQQLPLRFAVQGAGGLAQQQHRALREDRAGDGDALQLPIGQPRSPLAQRGVQPVFQFPDKAVGAGDLQRAPERRVVSGPLGRGKAHHLAQGAAHQGVSLGHIAKEPPPACVQFLGAAVRKAQIAPTRIRRIDTHQQLERGGFSTAAVPREGHDLPLLNLERQVLQRRQCFLLCLFRSVRGGSIRKGDLVQPEGVKTAAIDLRHFRCVHQRSLAVCIQRFDLHQALGGGQHGIVARQIGGDVGKGRLNLGDQHGDGRQRAEADAALEHPVAAVDHAEKVHGVHGRAKADVADIGKADLFHPGPPMGLHAFRRLPFSRLLRGEGVQHQQIADALLEKDAQASVHLLHQPVQVLEPFAKQRRHEQHRRPGRQEDRRKALIQRHNHHQGADQTNQHPRQPRQDLGIGVGHHRRVAGQTVEPLAGMHGADPGIVPGQDLMEQALLEGVLNAGAKALIQPAVERVHRQLGQHQRQYQRRIVPKPRRVLGARTVHDAAHQHRVGHARDAQQGMEKRQDENVAPFSSRYLI